MSFPSRPAIQPLVVTRATDSEPIPKGQEFQFAWRGVGHLNRFEHNSGIRRFRSRKPVDTASQLSHVSRFMLNSQNRKLCHVVDEKRKCRNLTDSLLSTELRLPPRACTGPHREKHRSEKIARVRRREHI